MLKGVQKSLLSFKLRAPKKTIKSYLPIEEPNQMVEKIWSVHQFNFVDIIDC